MKTLTTALAVALTGWSGTALAAELDLLDGANELLVPSYRAGVFFNGASDLDKGGEFSYEQLSMRGPLNRPIAVAPETNFFASLEYSATWLDFRGVGLAPLEDGQLHTLTVPLSILHRSEASPWSWLVRVDPGISSDFDDVNGHDLRLGARAGIGYRFSKTFSANTGVGLTEAFGDYMVVPLVGFDWTPAPDWFVSLSGPRLSAAYQLGDDWILRSAVYLAGGVWNVDVQGESRELTLRSIHAGVGAERRLSGKLWLTAWTGMSFANKVDLSTTESATQFESHADPAWFTYLGLRLAAW